MRHQPFFISRITAKAKTMWSYIPPLYMESRVFSTMTRAYSSLALCQYLRRKYRLWGIGNLGGVPKSSVNVVNAVIFYLRRNASCVFEHLVMHVTVEWWMSLHQNKVRAKVKSFLGRHASFNAFAFSFVRCCSYDGALFSLCRRGQPWLQWVYLLVLDWWLVRSWRRRRPCPRAWSISWQAPSSPITVGPQVNEFPDLVFFCGYYEVVKLAITLRLLPFLLPGFYFLPALPVSES